MKIKLQLLVIVRKYVGLPYQGTFQAHAVVIMKAAFCITLI
jgi:hypothetical protein